MSGEDNGWVLCKYGKLDSRCDMLVLKPEILKPEMTARDMKEVIGMLIEDEREAVGVRA